ncbi:MAG: hypothetical protein NTX25_02975, partial [Proteobacteria bacterium]|nr:hypothetical protein [Pseudomonadota bacterium]
LASHAHSHNYYDTLYAQRLEHIEGCWICNRFLRRICVNTPIQPLLFNPEYAYYRGQRYSAENGYLSYENRSIQIDYDYEADAWYFGNRENQLYWY